MLQAPLHSPDEMRQISNLVHVTEGIVLGTAAVIALLQANGRFMAGGRRYAWPAIVLLAGVLLLAYLVLPHHGPGRAVEQWRFVLVEPQQQQHVLIAVLVCIGSAVELLVLAGRLRARAWRLVWPAAVALVGWLFIMHPQHGTSDAVGRATLVHRVLGSTLLITAALAAANALRVRTARALAVAWPTFLLIAAILLVVYREPEGAYDATVPGHETMHRP